jgi:uncharacterized membrane protein YdjX (TVP38/TMEM64 family)
LKMEERAGGWKRTLLRSAIILAVLAALVTLLYFKSDRFQMHAQYIFRVLSRGDLAGLKEYIHAWGFWAPIVSAAIMILQSMVPLVPAVVLTIVNGWLFGAFWGTLLSWSAAMVGAILCFYIARGFGRPAAERFVSPKAMKAVDRFFERYGNRSILIARLIPVVPFDAVSYAAGLTSISVLGFLAATGIGQLPATIVYSWLGQNFSTSAKIGLYAFLGVAALLVLGFTIKKAMERKTSQKLKVKDQNTTNTTNKYQ